MAPSMKPMQMTIAACVDERPTASLAASNVGPKISRLATSRQHPSFFEPNPFAFLSAHHPLGKDKAGFYLETVGLRPAGGARLPGSRAPTP
jgi:hypothetical protein